MELSRKFRVLNQTLSMHTTLRDRYADRALLVDLLLLACSVLFCATAFASDQALAHLGPSPDQVRYLLRIFSVLAFMLSILSLKADWKGRSSSHRDAAARMSRAVAKFRDVQTTGGTWSAEHSAELDAAYWEAMHNSAPIPERSFVKLKAQHLRKIELSKMLDLNPGCPVHILRLILLCRSLKRSFGRTPTKTGEQS